MDRTRFNYKLFNYNFLFLVNFSISQPKYFYIDFEKSFNAKEKDFFKLKYLNKLFLKRNLNFNYFFNKQFVLCKKIIFINSNIINLIFF